MRRLSSNRTVLILALIAFGAAASRMKPTLSPDSRFYVALSDAILKGSGSVAFGTTEHASWTVIVLPLLISAARLVAPQNWMTIMVVFNVVFAAVTTTLIVAAVRTVTRSTFAAGVALLLSLCAFDAVGWLKFVLTDLLYTAIAVATFLFVLRGIMGLDPPARRIILVVLLLLCFVTRPAGVILIPVVLFIELVASRPQRLAPWLVVFAAALIVMILRAYFYDDMSRWPSDFMRPKLEEYAAREQTGEVIWDRKETFHQPPQTMTDHVLIESDRFVRFFQFISSGFSRAHNLINAAYYVPLYLFAGIGIVAGIRCADSRLRMVVQATTLWIAAVAWFHAITILDYDWRYRVPVLPLLILLAAIGADAVYARLRRQPWPARYTRSSA